MTCAGSKELLGLRKTYAWMQGLLGWRIICAGSSASARTSCLHYRYGDDSLLEMLMTRDVSNINYFRDQPFHYPRKRVMKAELSVRRLRGAPRFGWIDGVQWIGGSRGRL